MNSTYWQRIPLLPVFLAGFMALTRFHHFGSAVALPDASLAIFFFAGLGYNNPKFFGLLLAEAGLIDYLAISQFNVSAFCISPAYIFLIPTYALMWLAGRYCVRYLGLNFAEFAQMLVCAVLATTAAFTMSNVSFYLLSGQTGNGSWGHFVGQYGDYLPAYLSSTLIYIVIGLSAWKIRQALRLMVVAES